MLNVFTAAEPEMNTLHDCLCFHSCGHHESGASFKKASDLLLGLTRIIGWSASFPLEISSDEWTYHKTCWLHLGCDVTTYWLTCSSWMRAINHGMWEESETNRKINIQTMSYIRLLIFIIVWCCIALTKAQTSVLFIMNCQSILMSRRFVSFQIMLLL